LQDFVRIDAKLFATRGRRDDHLTEIKKLGDDLQDAARRDITNEVVPLTAKPSGPSPPANMEVSKCKPNCHVRTSVELRTFTSETMNQPWT
jgi:hypothetical protein